MRIHFVVLLVLVRTCGKLVSAVDALCGEWNAEIMIIQDVSFSFADDLVTLASGANPLLAPIFDLFPKANVGLASFSDKPDAYETDYCFNLDHRLTDDKEALIEAYKSLSVKNGGDVADSQLDAILHACRDPVGWTVGNEDESGMKMLRVVVLITDDAYHRAEDSSLPPYNSYSPRACEHHAYPYESEVTAALTAVGATPLFLVTSDVKDTYQTLLRKTLSSGTVATIQSDSSDLLSALQTGLATITCGSSTSTVASTTTVFDPSAVNSTVPLTTAPPNATEPSPSTGIATATAPPQGEAQSTATGDAQSDGTSPEATDSTDAAPPVLPVSTTVGIAVGGIGALVVASGVAYFGYERYSAEPVPPELEFDVELSGESGVDFDDFSLHYT